MKLYDQQFIKKNVARRVPYVTHGQNSVREWEIYKKEIGVIKSEQVDIFAK